MTVAELIEKLKGMPQGALVLSPCDSPGEWQGYVPATAPYVEKVIQHHEGPAAGFISSDADPARESFEAVILE